MTASGFKAHPRGLSSLFFVELWERFSYYGMRAILMLYLVLPVDEGGMGYSVPTAAMIYGNYTMSVYLLSVLGGFVADRWIGAQRAVLLGGLVISTGHFVLALASAATLYVGLACVALGTSLLKPNITVLVGHLYAPQDPRRDSGFSLFYMGINLGAFVAPLICGYLAQGAGFRAWLAAMGLDPLQSWHWGFAAAGLGMLAGLGVLLHSWRLLNALHAATVSPSAAAALSSDADRFTAIGFFCVVALLFWAAADQSGSTLNLFADRYTRAEVFGWAFPSSWFQSVSAAFVILLAPVFSILWLRLGDRQPASTTKALAGLAAAALSFVLLSVAARAAGEGPLSPWWLISVYFVQTVGELCLNPVGLSNVARLAPARLVGVMMGVWFIAIALGSKLAGVMAEWFGRGSLTDLPEIFQQQALFIVAAGAVLAMLASQVNRRMQSVERAWR